MDKSQRIEGKSEEDISIELLDIDKVAIQRTGAVRKVACRDKVSYFCVKTRQKVYRLT